MTYEMLSKLLRLQYIPLGVYASHEVAGIMG